MKKIFKMVDLDCANCAAKMESAIKKIKGVEEVNINFMSQRMILTASDEVFEQILNEAIKVCKKIEPDCQIIIK